MWDHTEAHFVTWSRIALQKELLCSAYAGKKKHIIVYASQYCRKQYCIHLHESNTSFLEQKYALFHKTT